MIVNSLLSEHVAQDIDIKSDRCRAMVYPLDDGLLDHIISLTLPGKTVFLFSGSWRLNMEAVYIELKHLQDCRLQWHPNTLFAEPNQKNSYLYILKKLQPQNFVILNSDYWTGHRPLVDILLDLDELKKIAPRVICSLPVRHANFNKLTTSIRDLCDLYPGMNVFNDNLVITQ